MGSELEVILGGRSLFAAHGADENDGDACRG
jgi:hypothetical protein